MSVKKKMLFDKGDRIQWTVSSTGYLSQSDQLTINEDTTINVNLVRPKIVFSWDGGGTKSVWFGKKEVTAASPIYLGNDGPMTKIDTHSFYKDSTTKNVFVDAEGIPDKVGTLSNNLSSIFNFDNNVIKNIEIINTSHLTNLGFLFSNMKYLKTVSIDTSSATTLQQMLANSAIVNPPTLDTSNATNVEALFYECTNLKYIPTYDFSKVTNMHGTFWLCPNITSVPYLDTHNVTDISYCFSDCTKLKTVPLLDFSNVTNTDMLFYNCPSLTDVGGFIGLKTDISIHHSPLTHASALNIIDNLAVSPGHKVEFKKSTFDTLTPAEIAKATDKGWTITYIL